LLRWVHAKKAALLLAAVWVLAKEAALLLAAVGACEDGCAAACCGGCWRSRLRCSLPCYCQPAHDGGGGGGFTVADGDRWVGANEAARLYCCLLLWVQRDGLRCGMMW
jgi:hypothetical protein